MLIVREVFTAKPGQAGKFAKLFKKVHAGFPGARVLTDFIGNYNTVVLEMQVQNLAEFERLFNEYKAGMPGLDPQLAKELANYTDLWLTGRREVYQIVE